MLKDNEGEVEKLRKTGAAESGSKSGEVRMKCKKKMIYLERFI